MISKQISHSALAAAKLQMYGDETGANAQRLIPTAPDYISRWALAPVVRHWNNLMLQGNVEPSDEEIVYEARENWHPDKLDIDRSRFFKAIQWMRKQGTTPAGPGKLVIPRKKK